MGPWGIPFADYEVRGIHDGAQLHCVRLPKFWMWTFSLALALQ
jgi:hypothetical protein